MRQVLQGVLVAVFLLHGAPCSAAAFPRNLAVPAFENLTGDSRLDWIGEGIARTLVEKLNAISTLRAANIKARSFYGPDHSVDMAHVVSITGDLVAEAVVFGAVVKASDIDRLDDTLEIAVRVVDLRTSTQLASLELLGTMRKLFSIEADLAGRVTALAGITLSPVEEASLRTPKTRSLLAYKETVLGSIYLEEGRYDAAAAMFEQAMENHPDIFFPKAHSLLARVYIESGRKEEMLKAFRKDAAELSTVYYDLAVANDFSGDPEEAKKNFGLFLKYTDHRTRRWRRKEADAGLLAATTEGVLLRAPDGRARLFSWESGAEITAAVRVGPTSPQDGIPEKLIPENERENITTGPVLSGDRLYYGLRNGYLVGRSLKEGRRTWAYKLRGVPEGGIAAGPGVLAAADSLGYIYCLGIYEGQERTDLSAYLKLAELAMRSRDSESAEEIYHHIVEEVKFNVPSAWHALWQIAKVREDIETAAYHWERYLESQY